MIASLKTSDYSSIVRSNIFFCANNETRSNLVRLGQKIVLKNKAPVYVPLYRLADTHKQALDKQIDEWLKIGVIQPTNSRYNSPIFVVPKKNGENRYVLDYRALNANSHDLGISTSSVTETPRDSLNVQILTVQYGYLDPLSYGYRNSYGYRDTSVQSASRI